MDASAGVGGVDPVDIALKTGKKALIGPFCEWVSEAVKWAREEPEMLLRSCRNCGKTDANPDGLLVAWEFESDERQRLLSAATELHEKGELWGKTHVYEASMAPSWPLTQAEPVVEQCEEKSAEEVEYVAEAEPQFDNCFEGNLADECSPPEEGDDDGAVLNDAIAEGTARNVALITQAIEKKRAKIRYSARYFNNRR